MVDFSEWRITECAVGVFSSPCFVLLSRIWLNHKYWKVKTHKHGEDRCCWYLLHAKWNDRIMVLGNYSVLSTASCSSEALYRRANSISPAVL